MQLVTLDRLRKLRRTVAGRTLQAGTDVERLAGELNHPAVIPYAHRARDAARGHIDLRTGREAQRTDRGDGQTKPIDTETDIEVSIVHDTAKRYAERMPQSAKGKAGARILRHYFRRGLAAVIRVPYEDELILVEHLHEGLTGRHAADAAVLGLTGNVEAIGRLIPQYRASLAAEERISAQAVADAYEALQVAWFELAFAIVTLVRDEDDRVAMLAPVFEQDDRLAALYAARRSGRSDVDLDTLDDEADAEAAALLDAELAEAETNREADLAAEAERVAEEVAPAPEAEPAEAAPEADPPALRPLPGSD